MVTELVSWGQLQVAIANSHREKHRWSSSPAFQSNCVPCNAISLSASWFDRRRGSDRIPNSELRAVPASKEMGGGSEDLRLLSTLAVVVVLLLSVSAAPAVALRFDLQSGHTKCISEDIKVGAMTVGKYTVVNPSDSEGQPLPDSHKITVRVTSPYGNSVHFADQAESGDFAFTSSEAGDYLACFWTPDHNPPATVTLDFEWRTGVAAKDWTNVAKKGQIDVMELELKKLEDTVKSIHDEMFYLREREEEMQDMNRTTNSRMAWLSLLSLAVCLSVAGMQLWHLKTFFEKKKLL